MTTGHQPGMDTPHKPQGSRSLAPQAIGYGLVLLFWLVLTTTLQQSSLLETTTLLWLNGLFLLLTTAVLLLKTRAHLHTQLPELMATPETLHLQQVAHTIDAALMVFDVTASRYVYVSPGYTTLWQRDPALLLTNPRDWIAALTSAERWRLLRQLAVHRHTTDPYRVEFPLRLTARSTKWVQMRFYPQQDGAGVITRLVVLADDITSIRQQEEQLSFAANHDPLTQLPNHRLFLEQLNCWLQSPPQHGFSLFMLDLDHFKRINDISGHASGDVLLREVATRLCTCIPPGALLARMSGDEFALLCPGVSVNSLAERIVTAIRSPFMLNEKSSHITLSLGWSCYPKDGANAETLLRQADMAMHGAKQAGRNRYQAYTAEMAQAILRQLQLHQDLLSTVNDGGFEIYYQPIYELTTGRLSGAEALLRWQRRPGEWVSPQHFIPHLEESGLIIRLTDWLIWETGKQLKSWRKRWPEFRLSVNISGLSMQDERLLTTAKKMLSTLGLPGNALELEVTESAFISDPEQAGGIARQLQAEGVQLAVDDFGTGYSSLISLQRFSPNRVKIDRGFIREVISDKQDRNLVESMLLMIHKLEMRVVAEGVETSEQLSLLRELGCDYIQGYYSGRPLPVAAWLQIAERLPSEQFGVPPRQMIPAGL